MSYVQLAWQLVLFSKSRELAATVANVQMKLGMSTTVLKGRRKLAGLWSAQIKLILPGPGGGAQTKVVKREARNVRRLSCLCYREFGREVGADSVKGNQKIITDIW
jgi:hypothetical protein